MTHMMIQNMSCPRQRLKAQGGLPWNFKWQTVLGAEHW
ncbi:hypothetical protein SZ54_5035 [Rhizobium sp. UR51a]|nr:hypothetical protein SZ54_5035 [Rhizobium sp. UR51a]